MSVLFKYMIDFCDEQISQWEKPLRKKVCVYCQIELPISSFPKHSNHKDNLDTRCRTCIRANSDITKKLKSVAPPTPEYCDCCGNIPRDNKFSLDHDHQTMEIRGWLCTHCNTALGQLGDNIEGVKKALTYLQKDKKAYNTRNVWMIRQD